MKKIYLLLLLVSSFAFGQGLKNKTDKKQFPAEILEIETFQKELNREYKTEEERINITTAQIPLMGFIDVQNISDQEICNTEYEIRKRIQEEMPKKNQVILVYCGYGGRSRNVCYEMRRMGYNNVFNLYGGINAL